MVQIRTININLAEETFYLKGTMVQIRTMTATCSFFHRNDSNDLKTYSWIL